MIAALALRPDRRRGEIRLRLGYLDFGVLFIWWTFLYVFAVLPWMYATPSFTPYNENFIMLANIQNMVIVGGLAALRLAAHRAWRIVFANLVGGGGPYLLSSLLLKIA